MAKRASDGRLAPKSRARPSTVARARYPILEFDRSSTAVLEPHLVTRNKEATEHCVLCFFQDVIDVVSANATREIDRRISEIGTHPIYEIDYQGRPLTVAHPRVGAPLGAAMLEALIAMGARKFIACGGAGVLDGSIAVGHIVVPTSAVRDEGTSYHYLPPAREVAPTPRALAAIKAVLKQHGHPYLTGKTWTTDAIYRETRAKIERRRHEGCLTVDMEASAFFAVAKFRRVEFGQIFYAGDDLSGEWDHRNWTRHEIREHLFRLAAEACLRL
jgi:uridine phosphorylase